jgi:hypothetical protein
MQVLEARRGALPVAVACLALSVVVVSVAAQEMVPTEECIKELADYTSSLEEKPKKDIVDRAQAFCKYGDLQGAKTFIDEASNPEGDDLAQQCQKEVDAYVARYNLKPNRQAAAEARAFCKKGDSRSAIRVVGRPQ